MALSESTKASDPAWLPEARRLRAEGLSVTQICRALNVSDSSCRWHLDEGDYRARHNEHKRRRRGALDPTAYRFDLVEKREPRKVRRIISAPEQTRDFARRYIAGEITREQMMRGIDQGAR